MRPYQSEAVIALWNELITEQTALLVLPTGGGKSLCFREFCKKAIAAKPDIQILILFNRVKLLTDQAKSFTDMDVGVYCATENRKELNHTITIASIKSIPKDIKSFNLIITDECHNISDIYKTFFDAQISLNPKCKIIGVTATPYKFDGYIYGEKKLFKRICYQKPMRYFIDKGWLVPPIAKQPDYQIDVSKLRVLKGEYRQDDIDAQTMNLAMARDQVRDALNRSHDRKKIVWFCSSINHAELIKSILLEEGELAVTVHSKMEWADRDISHNHFEEGSARHLTFISVISEGYDYPPIDCIVMMRPTRSTALMMQVIGRALRTYGEKKDALILDYGSVVATLGPIENPVIPKKGKGGKKLEMTQKACPQCRTYVAPRQMNCPSCGFNWPKVEATKLSINADDDIDFFKKKIESTPISAVKLDLHLSKQNNRCVKVTYIPMQFFAESITEYFAIDSDWGYRKFMARALEMEISLKQDIMEQVAETPKKVPSRIEFSKDGRYNRVQRLVFE